MATTKPHLDDLRRRLEAAADDLPPDLGLRFRAMFGGAGAYAHDRMFASLSDHGLALKLSPQDRTTLLHHDGARPLQYDPTRPVSKHYVVVPPAITADPTRLAPWLRRSVDFTATLPAPKRPRPKTITNAP